MIGEIVIVKRKKKGGEKEEVTVRIRDSYLVADYRYTNGGTARGSATRYLVEDVETGEVFSVKPKKVIVVRRTT